MTDTLPAMTDTPAVPVVPPATTSAVLDGDIATLTALRKALDVPDVPPLITRHLHDEGGTFTPWVRGRPVTALLRVVEVINVGVFVRHRPSPVGLGAEIVAACKLDGRRIEFVVQTWRYGPDDPVQIVTARNGLITRTHLAALAEQETRLLGGPDDPETVALGLPVAPAVADPAEEGAI